MNNLQAGLDSVALVAASVDWNNLISVGKLLSAVEEALEAASSEKGKEPKSRLSKIKDQLESFIMAEYKDKKKAIQNLEKLLEGLSAEAEIAQPADVAGSAISKDKERELCEYANSALSVCDELEQGVLELEKRWKEADAVNAVFRIVHTLKGETGFAGLPGLAEMLHHFEGIISVMREKPVALNRQAEDLLLSCVDLIKKTFSLCCNAPASATVQHFPEQCESLSGLKQELKALQEGSAVSVDQKHLNLGEREVERINLAEITDLTLYTDFINEVREHLEHIEVKVLELETSPGDYAVLNEIFRPLHTIKGVSGFLSLKHINRLSHDAENCLDLARNGKLLVDRECIDLIFEIVDTLRKLTHFLELQIKGCSFHDEDYPFVEALMQKILSVMEAKQLGSPAAGASAVVQKEKKLGEILLEQQVVTPTDLAEALESQTAEGGGKKLGEILIEQEKVSPKEVSDALRRQMDSAAKTDTSAVKVGIEKLDSLIDVVGELVISSTLIAQSPTVTGSHDPILVKNVSHMSKIVRDIQYVSMSLRMVPIKATFQKMARLVRDLSLKSGKQIELNISGAETELDKNVVEQINDPLVHMIRNSCDHGIESPDDRVRSGKPSMGRVSLNAFHQGGNIVIEVSDDGKGLDREAIRRKGIEKGLIQPDAILDDAALFNLIFEPGFSTAKAITDVSGRGVGMDVVRKNIEKLGGTVVISSEQGKGSIFTIRLPLTMAILDSMILKVGGERYLLPIVAIKESIKPERKDVTVVQGRGEVVNVRGMLIPLMRLYKIFNEPSEIVEPWNAIVIIVESGGKAYGLMVDDILGQQQVVIKSLKGEFRNLKGISGCSILGDGRVGLILDVKGLTELLGQ